MKILVVDDAEDLRDLHRQIFESAGYEVDLASDGTSALERVRRNPPDVVLTDIMMAGMSGLDLITHLRSDFTTPPLIVAVSGFAAVGKEALARGAAEFLRKPISIDDLVNSVARVLKNNVELRAVEQRTNERVARITKEAEQAVHEGRKDPEKRQRVDIVARWVGSLLEAESFICFVDEGKMQVTALSKASAYSSEELAQLPRIATDVLNGGSALLLAGDSVRRCFAIDWMSLVASPVRYGDQPIGAMCLLRRDEVPFDEIDLRVLKLLTSYRGAAHVTAHPQILSDNHLATEHVLEELAYLMAQKRDRGRVMLLAAIRTRELPGDPLPPDDPLFAGPHTVIGQLAAGCLGILAYTRRPVEELRGQLRELLKAVDARWGFEVATAAVYRFPPSAESGHALFAPIRKALDEMEGQPARTVWWLEQRLDVETEGRVGVSP